jgi:hypothetical protein
MGRKLYVGNLGYGVSNADLEQMFSQHGTVDSVNVIEDRSTGQSKGFGFVEMGSDAEAQDTVVVAATAETAREFSDANTEREGCQRWPSLLLAVPRDEPGVERARRWGSL